MLPAKSWLILAVLLSHWGYSAPIEQQTQQLTLAQQQLLLAPEDKQTQLNYLAAFPKDFADFLALFHHQELSPLADGHQQILLYQQVILAQPQAGVAGLLQLCSQACIDADAPNYLQQTLQQFIAQQPLLYQQQLQRLTPAQRQHIAAFAKATLSADNPLACR